MSVMTRMFLNPAKRGGRQLLFNRQAMHAAVMAAFSPDAHEQMDGRTLWRLDHDGNHRHTLYLVSPREPDLSHVVEQAGWAGESWASADYTNFLSRLRTGQQWGFRLTANPVRAVSSGDGRSRILPHVTASQQVEWLHGRAHQWGFELLDQDGSPLPAGDDGLPSVRVTERHDERFGRADRTVRGRRVALRMAQFDGFLQVTDAELFRSSLTRGMGRAKAYGCGLMTLRPCLGES